MKVREFLLTFCNKDRHCAYTRPLSFIKKNKNRANKAAAQIAHLVFAITKNQTQKTKRAISCQRLTENTRRNTNFTIE